MSELVDSPGLSKQTQIMKKLLFIFIVSLFSFALSAQTTKLRPIVANTNQGQFVDFGGVNLVPSDSLLVSDTAKYIIPVTHTNGVEPFLTNYWSKIGSGTATLTVNFYQANDPNYADFVTIKKGKLLTAYTKTLSLAASGWTNISFMQDSARFEGRYMMVEFITSSTASVKGKLFNRMKFNIR